MKKLMSKYIKIYKKYEEICNYLIIGGLTTLVNLIVKWIMLYTFLSSEDAVHIQIAICTSWIVSCIFAYITNRKFVFKSKVKNITKEIFSFFSTRLLTLGFEMIIMYIFVSLLNMNSDLWIFIWTIVSQIIVIILNYVFSKFFVFKKRKIEIIFLEK